MDISNRLPAPPSSGVLSQLPALPPPCRMWWVSGLNYLKWYLPYGHNACFTLLKGAWSRDKALSEDMGETSP